MHRVAAAAGHVRGGACAPECACKSASEKVFIFVRERERMCVELYGASPVYGVVLVCV